MEHRLPRPVLTSIVGVTVAVAYVVVAAGCIVCTTRAHDLAGSSPDRTRWLGFAPYAVLALGLLVAGVTTGRWLRTPWAPVVIAGGSFAWFTWLRDLPRHVAAHHWTVQVAERVTTRLYTTWHLLTAVVVVAGWGLIRRAGWSWVVGLVPAVVLIGVVEVIEHAVRPDAVEVAGDPHALATALRHYAHQLRVYELVTLGLTTLAVVGGVWLCVAAERFVSGRRIARA